MYNGLPSLTVDGFPPYLPSLTSSLDSLYVSSYIWFLSPCLFFLIDTEKTQPLRHPAVQLDTELLRDLDFETGLTPTSSLIRSRRA
jgi:hypothetical protein